jgi:hypothetical protein
MAGAIDRPPRTTCAICLELAEGRTTSSLFQAGFLFAEGISLSLLKGWALRTPDRWVMSATINRI